MFCSRSKGPLVLRKVLATQRSKSFHPFAAICEETLFTPFTVFGKLFHLVEEGKRSFHNRQTNLPTTHIALGAGWPANSKMLASNSAGSSLIGPFSSTTQFESPSPALVRFAAHSWSSSNAFLLRFSISSASLLQPLQMSTPVSYCLRQFQISSNDVAEECCLIQLLRLPRKFAKTSS